jgi:DNA-binding protein YbaB
MTESPFQQQIESTMRQIREQLDSFVARRDSVAAIVGEGTSADGLITVRTGPGGMMQDLDIDPKAMRMASQDLRDAILEAARNAAASYQEAVAEVVPAASMDMEKLLRDFGTGGHLGSVMAEFKRQTGDIEYNLNKLRRDLGL